MPGGWSRRGACVPVSPTTVCAASRSSVRIAGSVTTPYSIALSSAKYRPTASVVNIVGTKITRPPMPMSPSENARAAHTSAPSATAPVAAMWIAEFTPIWNRRASQVGAQARMPAASMRCLNHSPIPNRRSSLALRRPSPRSVKYDASCRWRAPLNHSRLSPNVIRRQRSRTSSPTTSAMIAISG